MPNLIHHIYTSAAQDEFTPDELLRILEQSRRNNGPLGVTGMLLHCAGTFFQILEGRPDTVESLFQKIIGDPRHGGVTTIVREAIHKRSFPEWTMGFAEVSASELATLAGTNDFFGAQACLTALDSNRSKKLLTAFTQGRWRRNLSDRPQPANP